MASVSEKSHYQVKDGAGEKIVERHIRYSNDPADFHYMNINVPCQAACPAFTNIPAYIRTLYEGRYDRSYELNRIVNVLPGVLGRICSRPCEDKCRHGEPELGQPVNICHIKRAASDFKEAGHVYREQLFAPQGKRVCIIGAGPAGLAAAHDLSTVGVEVDLVEAMEEPGGMLRYGIPAFRLPRDILKAEIDSIIRLGVNLRTNFRIGVDKELNEILSEYDAALITAGCYNPVKLSAPGEDLDGVFPGLQFVMDVASGKAPRLGEKVLIIGAGFTAFDCARLALRYGAKNAEICIRATEDDLRVTKDEIHEAKLEGIDIKALRTAKKIIGDSKVEGVEFYRTRLGERRPNGKRATEIIEGSEFLVQADSILVAIGQSPEAIPGPAKTGRGGVFEADDKTFKTSAENLYMAGDYMTGPSTVIEAIAAGRRAAQRIAEDLTGKKFREWAVRIEESSVTDRQRSWDFIPRNEMPTIIPAGDRFKAPEMEVELGYEADQGHEESKRCYLCYLHYEIDISKCIYCRYCIDVAPRDCIRLVKDVVTNEVGAITGYVETTKWRDVNAVVIDNSRCIRCGECLRVCPVDCISVSKVELVERVNQMEKGE